MESPGRNEMTGELRATGSPTRGVVLYCVCTLGVSLLLNVILGVNLVGKSRAPASSLGIPPGTALSSLPMKALDGSPSNLSFSDGRPTVLYVMSPGCAWCLANQETINQLASKARGSAQFIGLSLSSRGIGRFLSEHPATFSFYTVPESEDLFGLAFRVTPQTILLDEGGRVRRAWVGRLDAKAGELILRQISNLNKVVR